MNKRSPEYTHTQKKKKKKKQTKKKNTTSTNLTTGYTLCDVNTEDIIRHNIALIPHTKVYQCLTDINQCLTDISHF